MKLELLATAKIGSVRDLTLAHGAHRLIVTRGEKGALVLDATSGKEVGQLPKGAFVSAVDPKGTLAVVTEEGKQRGGRYEWNLSLWDLAKVKKVAVVAANHPDDSLGPVIFGATRILCLHKKKAALSLSSFDHAGKPVAEVPLGKVPSPFHIAMSPDERLAAHAHFTGAAQLVDLSSGKSQKLAGGALRIGRQHDRGITELAFDRSGEHLMYVSQGSGCAHVWSTRARKSLPGKWSKAATTNGFFVGNELGVMWSGSDGGKIHAFALAGKAAPRVMQVFPEATLLAPLGDERHIACAGHSGWMAMGPASRGIALWDFVRGTRMAKVKEPAGMNAIASLAACAGRIAVGDVKAGVAIYAIA